MVVGEVRMRGRRRAGIVTVAGLVTLSTICGIASLPFALSLLDWWPI